MHPIAPAHFLNQEMRCRFDVLHRELSGYSYPHAAQDNDLAQRSEVSTGSCMKAAAVYFQVGLSELCSSKDSDNTISLTECEDSHETHTALR